MARFLISEGVKKAQKKQDDIFKKMTTEQKLTMTGQLFELGKTLNALRPEKKWR